MNQKMGHFATMMDNYRAKKMEQLEELKTDYRRSTQAYGSNRPRNDTEDYNQLKIQLQPVNQQTLFQQHMIHLKEQQLLEIKAKMENALDVQKQMEKLVKDQGEQINQIEDNVDSARSNVKQAGQLLEEGVKHHLSAKKKKMCIIVCVFILVLAIAVPLIVKFIG